MVTNNRQPTMQLDGVGCRQSSDMLEFVDAETQGADVAAFLPEEVLALRNEPGYRRLAIRPGHADNAYLFRWTVIESIRYLAELLLETGDGDYRHADVTRYGRRGCRIKCQRRDARIDRVTDIVKPVATRARTGEKQEAFCHIPAIARNAK